MLRYLPGALDPGAPPVFHSPDDVTAWVRAVDWLVAADRAVVLHVDGNCQLTCVGTAPGRLQYLGPGAKEDVAAEALQCEAAGIIAVDLRKKLPASAPTGQDRRRHHALHVHLAVRCVALLDTVIVAPTGGVSVTGALCYPLGGGLSWLRVHVTRYRLVGDVGAQWTHDDAGDFPPASARVRDADPRPTLWLAGDSGE